VINRVFRVDDRLIHGQVIVGWVKRLELDTIVVANDRIVGDTLQRNLMELAIPKEVKVFFCGIEETGLRLAEPGFADRRFIVLLESLQDALELARKGVAIEELNVGGLHFRSNKKQYAPFLFLDDDDLEAIDGLLAMDLKMTCQPLPDDPKNDIRRIVRKEQA
jgi:mannose/fructose/N-acetylgalactosamine-specific phosphotransferase system component IIB